MVEGRFFIVKSAILTNEQKDFIVNKIKSKLIGEAVLLVKSQEARTQIANKALVVKKINEIINKALIQPKVRNETKVPKSVVLKRKEDKKKNSILKENRKKVKYE
jgi:ribosome-associated protein